MGEIIGAGVVSHVPPIVMPEADRKRLNDGQFRPFEVRAFRKT